MIYALPCLVGLTLLLCGSVAALADLVRESQPLPRAQGNQALSGALWVVRSPGDRWYVNGEPVSSARLPGLLAAQPEGTEIRFLPAEGLPLGQVSRSLARLRSLTSKPVALALPGRLP